MSESNLTERQLAWKVIQQIDALISREPDPRVEIKPMTVTARGKTVHVIVVTEEAWAELKRIMADSGCRELVTLVN